MKKSIFYYLAFIILSMLSQTISAQYPQWWWTTAIPSSSITNWDYTVNDIIETSNGDLVIAGSKTTTGRSIVFVARLNSEGDTLWTRTYPAIGINDVEFNEDALGIIQVPTGGFCVAGYRIVEPSMEGPRSRVLLMELDADGNKVRYGLVGRTYAQSEARSITAAGNNKYIVTGLNSYSGKDSIFLGSVDYEGMLLGLDSLRVKTIDGSPCWGEWAKQTENGTVIAGTAFQNKWDMFLMKTRFYRDPVWVHTYGHAESDQLSDVVAVDDGYFLVGYAEVDVPYGGNFYERPQVYVVRTDLDGNVIWEKTYGGIYTHYSNAACMTEDGNLMVIGTKYDLNNIESDIFLYKIDAETGDSIWQKNYTDNTSAAARVGISTADFGYAIAGQYTTGVVDAEKPILMIRLLNREGTRSIFENRSGLDMALLALKTEDIIQVNILEEKIYGVNCYIDTLLHPSVGDIQLVLEHGGKAISLVDRPPNSGANFINTLFLDRAKAHINEGEAPYTGKFRPEDSLAVFNGMDPNGDWILGVIDQSQKKGLEADEKILQGWGLRFLVQSETGTGIEPVSLKEQPRLEIVYPNPFREELKISFKLPGSAHVALSVFDIHGSLMEQLIEEEFPGGTYSRTWKVSGHHPGPYIIRFKAGNIIEFRKVVLVD